jgi:hypothetical protein
MLFLFFFAILPSEVQTFGLSALGLTLDISASQHVCLVMLKTKHYLRSVILAIPDTLISFLLIGNVK